MDYKDFSVVVQALKLRDAARRREILVMVGGGRVTRREAETLASAGLRDQWIQTDSSESELAGWYAQAQALIYPSRYEGFGMPLVEAMAWGCPIVASRSSCLPEVGGAAAQYFTPGEAEDLAVKLELVLQEPERTALVEAGRERERLFGWDSAIEKTLQLYRKVLK